MFTMSESTTSIQKFDPFPPLPAKKQNKKIPDVMFSTNKSKLGFFFKGLSGEVYIL